MILLLRGSNHPMRRQPLRQKPSCSYKTKRMKTLLAFLLLTLTQKAFPQTTAKEDTTSKTMKALVVSGSKRPIEVQPDKTVLNVDAGTASIGQNVIDYLRQAPGVVIDAAENIQLAGRPGVTVYIDGKNTQLSAQDLAQLLKSIEVSNVRQIEIVTSPSAKYDAAGNAGIINIKLKKSLTDGFNGTLTGSYAQSKHARGNATTNLAWHKGKTVAFFNGGINDGLQHVIADNDRTAGARTFTQRSLEKDFFHGHSVRAGLDYSLSKKATLGVLWMKNYRYTRMENGSNTFIHLPGATDTAIYTKSLAPFPVNRNSFNLNYNFNDKNFTYGLDADYTLFRSSLNNIIANEAQNGSGAKLYTYGTQNNADVDIRLSSFKGDMEKIFAGGVKLESGFKVVQTTTDNRLQVSNSYNSTWGVDTGKTNNFRYKETIGALYASIKKESGKWNWQAGLRAEHTTVNGSSVDLKGAVNNRPDTAYFNLFPTLYLQYAPTQTHHFNLTANRRIDRPSYQDQNPFIYVLDALNSEQGNPYLMPQFTTAIEVSYTYKWATSVKLGYAHTTNYFEGLTYQVGKGTVMIPQNAGTKDMVSLSLSTPLQPAAWWNVYLSLTPYYHYYHVVLSGFATSETQSGGSFAFNGYVGNNFTLGKGWKGEISSWFNYQNRAAIYVSKPIGSVNAGVQKNIWKDKATLKLSIVDILNTQCWQQTATTRDFQLTTYRKWESRNLTLGFSWRFGNKKIKGARERQTGGEKEAERIKQ